LSRPAAPQVVAVVAVAAGALSKSASKLNPALGTKALGASRGLSITIAFGKLGRRSAISVPVTTGEVRQTAAMNLSNAIPVNGKVRPIKKMHQTETFASFLLVFRTHSLLNSKRAAALKR